MEMAELRRWLLRLWTFLRPQQAERELARELTSHLSLLEDDLQRKGRTPAQAYLIARRLSGGVDQAKELHRDARSFPWLEDLRRDATHAVRGLARNPGFTGIAILTLALGIGANSAMFSVVNAILLRPLPYPESDRLVRIIESGQSPDGIVKRTDATLDLEELALLRTNARTLSYIGGYPRTVIWLTTPSETRQVIGARISPSILSMLGARPLLGRAFREAEEMSGEPLVLLSFTMWQRYLAARSDVVGTGVVLDGTSYTVVGVMPSDFEFPDRQTLFWLPLGTGVLPFQRASRLRGIAQLAAGISTDAASHEVSRLLDEYRGNIPPGEYVATAQPSFDVVRVHEELVAPLRTALLVLAGAVGFVLLIACVNVANLSLARIEARRREFAMRLALGASRWRIIRQVLTESCVLSFCGGVAAIGAAFGGVRLLKAIGATLPRSDLGSGVTIPRLDEVSVDWTVLAFTLAVTALTAIACGFGPALTHSDRRSLPALRGNRPSLATAASGVTRSHTHDVLVVVEVAAAVVLVTGAGLLLHSFTKLSTVNPGYEASDVLTFQVSRGRYSEAEHHAFAEALVSRLEPLPGVRAAGYAADLPMMAGFGGMPLKVAPDAPDPLPETSAGWLIGGDFLSVMRMPVTEGRVFGPDDRPGSPPVILVNKTLARQAFGSGSAVGKRLYSLSGVGFEVIGVVGDVRRGGLDQAPGPQRYASAQQSPGLPRPLSIGPYIAVRTDPQTSLRQADILAIARQLDPRASVESVATMEEIVANSLARPRFYSVLVTVFSGMSVALAALGIFGVMAYSVARRTREFGIRLALGATRADVMRLVLAQSTRVTITGVAVGIVGAAMLTRYLRGLLFEVDPLDVPTFLATSLLFSVVAFIAAWFPAHRASRVDPLIALRWE